MEIIFRGKNTKDEWVEGSLVTTNRFIRHKPKNHSKHWIVETSFGNGGWFNVQGKQYVKSDTLEMKFFNEWIPVEQVGEALFHRVHCKEDTKIKEV